MAVASGVLGSILDWLRAGYPDGMPSTDYVPLMVVLGPPAEHRRGPRRRRRAGPTGDLPADPPRSTTSTSAPRSPRSPTSCPAEDDVSRVRARLAQGGWPLADPRVA